MNSIYQEMHGAPSGGNMLQRFMDFKNNFHGNAQQQIQQLLNSGKVSQAQYNQAVQMAQQFQRMLGGR